MSSNPNYTLTTETFFDKASEAITLAEHMSKVFGSFKGAINLNDRQKEHLKIAIAAACLDAHSNGFRNGIHAGSEVN